MDIDNIYNLNFSVYSDESPSGGIAKSVGSCSMSGITGNLSISYLDKTSYVADSSVLIYSNTSAITIENVNLSVSGIFSNCLSKTNDD